MVPDNKNLQDDILGSTMIDLKPRHNESMDKI